jgi:hypothetical protein
MLTVGSLFAGIGGFDLGFERAGFDIKWQVEIDPFCQKVLAKHWPYVDRYDDVRRVHSEETCFGCDDCLQRVDLVCGGFPCQPFSSASRGRRQGRRDDHYLWFLTWKRTVIKSRLRWKFRLAPSDLITGGRASGFSATPTETANQGCPSMQKWPWCRNLEMTPEAWEHRMGYPEGWTRVEWPRSGTPSSRRSRNGSRGASSTRKQRGAKIEDR